MRNFRSANSTIWIFEENIECSLFKGTRRGRQVVREKKQENLFQHK